MKLHPLVQSLRNAYEAHDRVEFDRLCVLMQQRLSAAAALPQSTAGCSRGSACRCIGEQARALCSHRSAQPKGAL